MNVPKIGCCTVQYCDKTQSPKLVYSLSSFRLFGMTQSVTTTRTQGRVAELNAELLLLK